MELKYRTAPAALDTENEGRLKAAFSVLNEIDTDGDVVLPSAFTPGQIVPMVWGHDWKSLPIGKGVVAIEGNHAVFDGAFFLNTTHGRDAYETIKAMGDRQEYSFGFNARREKGQFDGKTVNFIKEAEIFEVSPVLVGANRNTRTLAIKGMGRSWDDQDETLTFELDDYIARARSMITLYAKEGRQISTARRASLEAMLTSFEEHTAALRALLEETAPRERDADGEAEKAATSALFAEYLALEARALGVQV